MKGKTMIKSPIEEGFLKSVWNDILKRNPGMESLPDKAKWSIELGFIYGAAVMSGVVGEFSRVMPNLSKQAQELMRVEANAMMVDLRGRVVRATKEVGATPDVTGFPLDKEFKL
jgi:hypothetical protein